MCRVSTYSLLYSLRMRLESSHVIVTKKPRGENGKLSKRVLAAFLVTLFIVATFATVAEVKAHYTLGEQGPSGPVAGTYGSTVNTYPDTHVVGHIAYVTPGLYFTYPRDQLPNYYSPDGSIITDTQGSLKFYLNFTIATFGTTYAGAAVNITNDGLGPAIGSNWLYIAIPPEFTPVGWNMTEGETKYVATSITNNYGTIATGKFADDHDLAPGWWYVAISSLTKPGHGDKGFLYTKGNDPYKDRQIRGGTFDGCYWVWVGGLKAPSIAGKYFFKVFYTDYLWPNWPFVSYTSFQPENYPTLVVKGELDPGYISGHILYSGSYYFGYYYGKGIEKPGRVIAEGEAIDPVTNEPTGRKVMAWGFFNASARGFYEIEGVAPGIYTITAEAAGFPPVTLAKQITVKRGQSIHGVDFDLYPGAKIRLKVNSKCPNGSIDFPHWVALGATTTGKKLGYTGALGNFKAKIFDEEGNFVASKKGTWTLTGNGLHWFEVLFGDPTSYEGADILWDGHVPDDDAHYISGAKAGVYKVYAYVYGYVQLDEYEVVVPSAQYTGEIMREIDIFQGGKAHVTVHFHNLELPSAEAAPVTSGDLILEAYDEEDNLRAWNFTAVTAGVQKSVDVDMIGDAWIPYGMNAGTYTFKVWYPGYAQQEFPGHTIQLCTWGTFSFHLVKGANITVTVYSRDWQSPAQVLYWLHPPSKLRVYFYNSAGDYVGRKSGNQVAGTDRVTFNFHGTTYGIDDYIAYGYKPSGLPTDVYTIQAFTVGYVQKAVPEVWAQKASSTGDIPLYLYAGAEIHITVNFKKEELIWPLPDSEWSYYFRINVFDEEGNLAAANISAIPQAVQMQPGVPSGVQQWNCFSVLGFNEFDTPGKFAWVPPLPLSAIETGFVPSEAFGYWEPDSNPTTGVGYHKDYGIDAGTYTLEVIDETNGYVQTATVAVTVTLMGKASVILDMHMQAAIYGTVYQRNYMGDFRTASWYTVELSGSPASTTATRDGSFFFYAPAGTYTLKVYLAAPDVTDAVVTQERTVVVTWGADAAGQNFYLEEGGVPIPEFPAAGVLMLISALAASLYLLRWRKQAIVPMP